MKVQEQRLRMLPGMDHNGTLTNGPTWGTGKYGQGINFDGTNDYVNIADQCRLTRLRQQ